MPLVELGKNSNEEDAELGKHSLKARSSWAKNTRS